MCSSHICPYCCVLASFQNLHNHHHPHTSSISLMRSWPGHNFLFYIINFQLHDLLSRIHNVTGIGLAVQCFETCLWYLIHLNIWTQNKLFMYLLSRIIIAYNLQFWWSDHIFMFTAKKVLGLIFSCVFCPCLGGFTLGDQVPSHSKKKCAINVYGIY